MGSPRSQLITPPLVGRGLKNSSPLSELRAYLRRRHDPLTSLVLTIPVFLVYHLGILSMQHRNGADLVSAWMFALLDYSVWGYVAVTLGFAGLLMVSLWFLHSRGVVRPAALLPVVAESSLWSFVLLISVGWTTNRLFPMQVPLQLGDTVFGPLDKLVMAAGAGFHEEVVFRVVLYSGGALMLHRIARLGRIRSLVWAGLVSALLFAWVHHLGPMGDAFSWPRFTFRVLAGGFLTVLFAFRGFAVAVYTHALYDTWVFFALGE